MGPASQNRSCFAVLFYLPLKAGAKADADAKRVQMITDFTMITIAFPIGSSSS